jgi:hypothetical protein
VLVELDRHDDEPGRNEQEEPQDHGQPRARDPHQEFMGQELAAAREIPALRWTFPRAE